MVRVAAVAVVCAVLGAVAGAAGIAAAAQGSGSLSWLAGCWATPGAEPGSGEMWTSPAGGTLLGVSRTVRGGQTVAWEFMVIRDEADGTYFVAKPSGQPEARFRAVSLSATKAVFENPAHDFPQRVIYERRTPTAVTGRIEGTTGGRARSADFPLESVPCR